MAKKKVKGIEKEFSPLVYGTGTRACAGEDVGLAIHTLDLAWESGFCVFDTANSYGKAEENLGKWLIHSGHRNEVALLDKGCNPGQKGSEDVFNAATIQKQLALSLDRLQTESVEMYILHRDDITKPVDEIVEMLNEVKAKGLIQKFGGSNWTLTRIQEANKYAKQHGLEGFTVCSPNFCLADLEWDPWGSSVTLSRDFAYQKWLKEIQMPVFNYSSLARGYLSGTFNPDGNKAIEDCISPVPIEEYDSSENRERLRRAWQLSEKKGCSISQLCLAWVLCQDMNMFPIVSPGSKEHMTDNMGALDVKLSREEITWLHQ